MKEAFFEMFESLTRRLRSGEVLLANYQGESSDFVRYSQGKVRQPGHVREGRVNLELISGMRHVSVEVGLEGRSHESGLFVSQLEELRAMLPFLPEDPHLLYSTEVQSSNLEEGREFPEASELLPEIAAEARELDLVGLLAAGEVQRGFANSLGQQNWFSTHTFNFDFSLYAGGDRAAKSGYAGKRWEAHAFSKAMHDARRDLELVKRAPKTIEPGEYRVFFAPRALAELFQLLSWSGFGVRSHRTRQTPFLRMLTEEATLSPKLTVSEDLRSDASPRFQSAGFIKPERVVMLKEGRLGEPLVSPRSAREYQAATNGAGEEESPMALSVDPGALAMGKALAALDRGLYVNNLHYLNYSDRSQGRITGMTRFATLWVERGEPVSSVKVMRFDETIFRMFGEKLVDLTIEAPLLLSTDTYGGRSTAFMQLPGALVSDFRLTL